MPEVKVGDTFPSVSVEVKELVSGEDQKPVPINIAELTFGKKVAIFGVPGAFTPGCSKSHLPSFMEAAADLKAKGVDMILCVATNDAYVMEVRLTFYTV
jgi:peroxiredoxin